MATLHHENDQKTILEIINLYESKTKAGERRLNLSPGFQRQGVWTERDRKKLIDSILRNYPLPAIFLYRREEEGEIIYDVIDGKQRLESILMFTGNKRGGRFDAKVILPGETEKEWVDWNYLIRNHLQHHVTSYKLNAIEVSGDPSDIIDLFVRINSLGKPLSSAEKRHAKYNQSEFLKKAHSLANYFEKSLQKNKVLTPGQITRMKHVELMSELMASIHVGDVINKKTALDNMMKIDIVSASEAKRLENKTKEAINKVFRTIKDLKQTRFKQISDFYSLAVLFSKFMEERLILSDSRKNRLANELLVAFGIGVDEARERQKKAESIRPQLEKPREYLLKVLQSTDEKSKRKRREEILRGMLESLFSRKDKDRIFSPEQRRILWNTTAERRCKNKSCNKKLTWEDFTIDHIRPYTKGGRTQLKNAALLCRSCNSSKGGR